MHMSTEPEELLTPDQVAGMLGVTTHTLAVWRCEGRYNLPYHKVGRLVRYRMNDVESFLDARRQAQGPDACSATA